MVPIGTIGLIQFAISLRILGWFVLSRALEVVQVIVSRGGKAKGENWGKTEPIEKLMSFSFGSQQQKSAERENFKKKTSSSGPFSIIPSAAGPLLISSGREILSF